MYELLHLLDMPGLNDTRPWANYNISQARAAAAAVLLLLFCAHLAKVAGLPGSGPHAWFARDAHLTSNFNFHPHFCSAPLLSTLAHRDHAPLQAIAASTDLLLLPSRNLSGDEATLQSLISSGWLAQQVG